MFPNVTALFDIDLKKEIERILNEEKDEKPSKNSERIETERG